MSQCLLLYGLPEISTLEFSMTKHMPYLGINFLKRVKQIEAFLTLPPSTRSRTVAASTEGSVCTFWKGNNTPIQFQTDYTLIQIVKNQH